MFTGLSSAPDPDDLSDLPELSTSFVDGIIAPCDENGQMQVPVFDITSPAPSLPPPPSPRTPMDSAMSSPLPPPPTTFEMIECMNEVEANVTDVNVAEVNENVNVAEVSENVSEENVNVAEVSEMYLPARRKIRGRHRGSNTTGVSGVRKRGYRVKAFDRKTMLDKQNLVLKMLIKTPVRGKKRIYDGDDIKDVTDVSSAVIDDDFDIGLVTVKLTRAAQTRAARVVGVKKVDGEYVRPVCKDVCGEEPGKWDR